jgi:hypothetical protein
LTILSRAKGAESLLDKVLAPILITKLSFELLKYVLFGEEA